MSKGSQVAALLFVGFVAVRLYLNDRIPDDATTIAMKRAGIYGYVIAGGCCVLGSIVIWLICEQFRLGRQRKELNRLRRRIARLRAEDHARTSRTTR